MRLAIKEQIVINVILDTMVMELHVLPVALTRQHLQVVVLQLQQIVHVLFCLKISVALTRLLNTYQGTDCNQVVW